MSAVRGQTSEDAGRGAGGRRRESSDRRPASSSQLSTFNPRPPPTLRVALLTAGRDRPYALGLAAALISQNVAFDFVGSDEVDSPELHKHPQVRVLNLRNQRSDANFPAKTLRVLVYYWRLIRYAANAQP